jgi:transposase InsO family protein
MDDETKKKFKRREKAVDLFLSGTKLKKIEELTGIKSSHIVEFVEKCYSLDENGSQWGYVALIPYNHTKQKKGSFENLMDEYPDIRDYLIFEYYSAKKKWNKFPSYTELHKSMLKKLHSKGLTELDYPFCTKLKGYRSMVTFLNNYSDTHPLEARISKDAKQLFIDTDFSQSIDSASKRPFAKIEIDGHKIDALFSVEIRNEHGDKIFVPATRIWIIVAIDTATKAILGYHISVSENYNRFDILECINNAIKPHEIFEFKYFDTSQNKIDGFHTIYIPETEWAIIDEIALDNALAHLSKDLLENLETYKINVNFGPVATPTRRPVVERFFKTLEERGFHKLPSTTGSDTSDIRRNKPEKEAISFEITLQEIKEIAEITISNYNKSPHSGLDGFTPLEIMNQRIQRGLLPSYVLKKERENFSIMKIYQTRKVQGNKKKGIRPYINFEGFRYAGNVLSSDYSILGDYITLEINPADIRQINVFLDNGAPIGKITIKGKQIEKPISLKNTQLIKKYMKEKMLQSNNLGDVIDEFTDDLKDKAITNKRSATRLASIQNDIQKHNPEFSLDIQNIDENETAELKSKMSDKELRERWLSIYKTNR